MCTGLLGLTNELALGQGSWCRNRLYQTPIQTAKHPTQEDSFGTVAHHHRQHQLSPHLVKK
jgi:hypothetical protein